MKNEQVNISESPKRISGWLALSPAFLFLVLYVVVSLSIGDFYVMPITVALLASCVWAMLLCRGISLAERIEVFSQSAAQSNIMYMLWIFVLAGAFAALAKGIGAIDASVALMLRVFPPTLLLPAIFASACFISLSIGTSVGTVVALVPLVVSVAEVGNGNVPLFVATVLGGAFFGDNLSFISDTTIAATRTQGCAMAEKFKANIRIVLPAALVTILLYFILGQETCFSPEIIDARWWLMTPYLVIIVLSLTGLNVAVVLLCGIVSALLLGMMVGVSPIESCCIMGVGIDAMGQLIIITLLAAGMLGLIKKMGGIDVLLHTLTLKVHGSRGAKACIAVLVGIVNLCTANNTVAIVTVGSLSRDISKRYGIPPRTTASLLDTCSCIVQCLIPYGAQTLLATGLAGISPAAPWPYLYYPWALAIMVAIAIVRSRNKR